MKTRKKFILIGFNRAQANIAGSRLKKALMPAFKNVLA